jgi:hypothetical protein
MTFCTSQINLIAHRLKAAQHHRIGRPLPDSQRWQPPTRRNRIKQYLIEGHMHKRHGGRIAKKLPLVALPW